MPDFTPGVETVLFLTGHNASGHAWPVGLSQGAFAVRRDPGRSDARVYRRLSGINLLSTMDGVGAAKSTAEAAASNPLDGGMDLDDFLSQVRAIVHPDPDAAGERE